jgi:hypothetical protein
MKRGIAIAVMLCCTVLTAQEKKEATQKDADIGAVKSEKPDAPLPKIELPEFVITGNERINLNISSKAEEDEERLFVPEKPTPGFRSYDVEGVVSQKQVKQFSKTPSALNGKVFAGFGLYTTPQFDGWFGQYDQQNSFVLNGNYFSTEGHVNDAGLWRGGFGAKGRYVMPESSQFLPYMQLNGDLQYGREAYHAYASVNPTSVRDLSAFDLLFGAGSRYALPYKSLSGFDYTGKFGWNYFSAKDSLIKSSETDFYLNGIATTRFLQFALRGQVEYRTTGYTMNLLGIQSGQWFVLKGDGQTLILPSLLMSFALQQFFYRGNVGVTNGRLYPQIEFKYFMTESASMYAGFVPEVKRNTLSSLVKQNRYMDFTAKLLQSDMPVNVIAGLEFSPVENLTASAKYTYRQINNYPTFLDTGGAKVWEVTYLSGVRASRVDISVVYRFDAKQNVTMYAGTEQLKQKDSSGVLPYIPKFSVGSIYHRFFDMGLHLEAAAEYVSSRYTNFSRTHSNAGYLYTSVKGDIELMNRFRGYAEIHNLLNQQYYLWNGYRERTLFVILGMSYQW